MANASVADLFAETLQGIGVRRIYGVVGDSLNAITESLRQRGGIAGAQGIGIALGEERPRQPARPRADLDHRHAGERAGA